MRKLILAALAAVVWSGVAWGQSTGPGGSDSHSHWIGAHFATRDHEHRVYVTNNRFDRLSSRVRELEANAAGPSRKVSPWGQQWVVPFFNKRAMVRIYGHPIDDVYADYYLISVRGVDKHGRPLDGPQCIEGPLAVGGSITVHRDGDGWHCPAVNGAIALHVTVVGTLRDGNLVRGTPNIYVAAFVTEADRRITLPAVKLQ